jgi:hypothetical protein
MQRGSTHLQLLTPHSEEDGKPAVLWLRRPDFLGLTQLAQLRQKKVSHRTTGHGVDGRPLLAAGAIDIRKLIFSTCSSNCW